jgi:hypothetical protein
MEFILLALGPKKRQNLPRHPIMEISQNNKFNFYSYVYVWRQNNTPLS